MIVMQDAFSPYGFFPLKRSIETVATMSVNQLARPSLGRYVMELLPNRHILISEVRALHGNS